jgi:hypothetical protein
MTSSLSFVQSRFLPMGEDWLNHRRSLGLPKFSPSVRDISGDVLQDPRDKWITIGNGPNSLILIADSVCLGCAHE